MKNLWRIFLPAWVIVVLAGCGGNDAGNNAEDSTGHGEHTGMQEARTPTVASVRIKDDKLNAVYRQYALLTTALIEGDILAAKVASNAIEFGAKEVSGGEAMSDAAARIIRAADMETQRAIYADLSRSFISLVKQSGVSSGTLYIDFCPMAMQDKGAYWLSEQEAIRNPYFGEQMMTCGNVEERISSKPR